MPLSIMISAREAVSTGGRSVLRPIKVSSSSSMLVFMSMASENRREGTATPLLLLLLVLLVLRPCLKEYGAPAACAQSVGRFTESDEGSFQNDRE